MSHKNPGYIYVIEEHDFLTGEPSGNVKIGIVKSPRVPADRLPEHQTGNSRELSIASEYPAESVSQAEALIHSRLSTKRLVQEWFVIDKSEQGEALADEIKLAICESDEISSLREHVDKLSQRETKGKTRKPRDSELEAMTELTGYLASIRALELRQAAIRAELASKSKDAFGIEKVGHWTYSPPKPSFKESKFKELDSAVYQSMMTAKVSGMLKLEVPKLSSPAKLSFPSELERLCSEGTLIERTGYHEDLHLKYLTDEEAISHLRTMAERIQLQLAVSIGGFERIDGVGTWVRKPKEVLKTGYREDLRETHPKLFEACVSLGSASRGFDVTRFRSYPNSTF